MGYCGRQRKRNERILFMVLMSQAWRAQGEGVEGWAGRTVFECTTRCSSRLKVANVASLSASVQVDEPVEGERVAKGEREEGVSDVKETYSS